MGAFYDSPRNMIKKLLILVSFPNKVTINEETLPGWLFCPVSRTQCDVLTGQ